MSKTAEISAVLRRSSESSAERIALVFYALKSRNIIASGRTASEGRGSDGVDAEGGSDWSKLSLPSLLTSLHFSFPHVTPRFLFALGINGVVLRSPDCGVTWKRIFTRQDTEESGGLSLACPTSSADAADGDLGSITKLLSSCEEPDGEEASVSRTSQNTITSISTRGDCVAMCGKGGFFAVSVDRGVSFTTASNHLVSCLEAEPERVAVLSDSCVLVASLHKVALVPITASVFVSVTLGTPRVIFTCAGGICLLKVVSALVNSSTGAMDIVVAESGLLHLSFNSGDDFLSFRHQLGSVRDVDSLAAVRHCLRPLFPASSQLLQTLVEAPAAPRRSNEPASHANKTPLAYEYACGYSCDISNIVVDTARSFERLPTADGVYHRAFLAVGTGAEVLPYDYSCILHLAIRVVGSQVTVFTVATNVDYIPFSRSGPGEQLVCAVSSGMEGFTAARGNSCGVSYSKDFCSWSMPAKSTVVAIVPSDAGELIVASQRNTLWVVGKGEAVRVIPADTRVPSLRTVVAL